MRFFLRHQPENLTSVQLSRNLPQLGIASARARSSSAGRLAASSWPLPSGSEQFFDCRLTSPIGAAESSAAACDDVGRMRLRPAADCALLRATNNSPSTPVGTASGAAST